MELSHDEKAKIDRIVHAQISKTSDVMLRELANTVAEQFDTEKIPKAFDMATDYLFYRMVSTHFEVVFDTRAQEEAFPRFMHFMSSITKKFGGDTVVAVAVENEVSPKENHLSVVKPEGAIQ